jgi:hypothetical protein
MFIEQVSCEHMVMFWSQAIKSITEETPVLDLFFGRKTFAGKPKGRFFIFMDGIPHPGGFELGTCWHGTSQMASNIGDNWLSLPLGLPPLLRRMCIFVTIAFLKEMTMLKSKS